MNTPIIILVFYAALHDIRFCRISNSISFSIIIFGVLSILLGSFNHLSPLEALLGLTLGLLISLILCVTGLFGAGDAKLLASLGIIFGPVNVILLIACAIAFSGLLSIFRLLCYGEFFPMISRWYQSFLLGCYQKPEHNTIASSAVPMGGAILLATVFCEFYIF